MNTDKILQKDADIDHSIFGVGENDPPDSSVMLDQIHYNASFYPKYKTQITSQCNIIF
jgi:hypothetical protein